MTKREAFKLFQESFPPQTFTRFDRNGLHTDKPMRDEAWNNFTDALCKDKQITRKQYETWTHPFNG